MDIILDTKQCLSATQESDSAICESTRQILPHKQVAVVCGSLRKQSFNKQLALFLMRQAQAETRLLDFQEAQIGNLPLYNEDIETPLPKAVQDFKKVITESDIVLFITPEYNRSIPGVLKNAIDWGSRPTGKNAFQGKKAAILGVSPGAIGTALAQAHLRQILQVLGMTLVAQPEIYITYQESLFDDSKKNESQSRLKKQLSKLLTGMEQSAPINYFCEPTD